MLRIRLRAKVMLGVSLVLLPLLGLLLFGLVETYEMRQASLLNSMSQTAHTAGLLVDTSLQDARRLAQTIAAETSNQELEPRRLRTFIKRLGRERTELINLGVFDTAGRLIASATPAPAGLDISDRPYFQRALQAKEPVISELIIGRTMKRPAVVAAAPILADDDDVMVRGVVTVSLRLEQLARGMLDIGLRPEQALFVTDARGRLVFHTSRQATSWEEQDLSRVPEVQQALGGSPVLSTEFRGLMRDDRRIAAMAPTAQHGWLVGVTWSTRAAFEELRQVHQLQLAAFVAFALLALAGAWVLATYLCTRVSRLVEHARTVGRGEFVGWAPIAPSRIATGDELDELIQAFNQMAGELKEERGRRETFISSVAHDMKNLTTPLSLAARLLWAPERQTPEARERTLERLMNQTKRIERLVSDLLDASRLDAGHFTLFPQRQDLMKLVRGVLDEQQAGASGHRLVLDGPEMLELEADPDRLAQVLTNLVGNGIKYSPEGGEVTVTVSDAGDTVRVAVADRGMGLLPQELEEVFAPYARATQARKIRGLGLGLYICRAIIEAHGGTLQAESAGCGQGATFTFTLPRRPPAARRPG
jgi:signal transduction histidine kinase